MKKLLVLCLSMLAIGMATFVSSCSETEQLVENETLAPVVNEEDSAPDHVLTRAEFVALTVQEKGTYKITESEALQHLEEFNPAVVSGESQSPVLTAGITLRKSPQTGKDMYYEVVIESDKGTGFCLLSADERADELLCYTENGSIADTAFNKSLKYCLELVDLYVEQKISEELDIETLSLSAQQKIVSGAAREITTKAYPPFNPDDPNSPWYWGRTDVNTTVSERLKLVQGGWHQGSPFNDFLPYIPGANPPKRAYAGCSIIAAAQIMSYHKKPFSNFITAATWTSILNNPQQDALRNLILAIFNSTATTYTTSGTPVSMAAIRSFLNSNGYTAGSSTSYSYNNVWSALNYGPTWMQGTRTIEAEDEEEEDEESSHAWVVDGARTINTKYTDIYYCNYNGSIIEADGSSYTITSKQVHYDWGWGPNTSTNDKRNAWFSDNVFVIGDRNYNIGNYIISSIY
jgi:uncharacterized protein YvpB